MPNMPTPATAISETRFVRATGAGTDADPHVPEVAAAGRGVARTDRSGSITTGGATGQVVMSANAARRAMGFQNTSSADLRISSTGTASSTVGILVGPSQLYEAPPHDVPTGAITVWGASTGQTFTAYEVG